MIWKRLALPTWAALIAVLLGLHFLHLSADFPNGSPWHDWAKYTDEGWYGSAAVRARLTGNWYLPGDFNPAAALPLLPLLESALFAVTGVSLAAARALVVAIFAGNVGLACLLVRSCGSRLSALLAATLLAGSSFLFAFSRLAILEPLVLLFALAALNLAVRLPRFRHQQLAAAATGLCVAAMIWSKTTSIALLPAIGWAFLAPWSAAGEGEPPPRARAWRLAGVAAAACLLPSALYLALLVRFHYWQDFLYLFTSNRFTAPHGMGERLQGYLDAIRARAWVGVPMYVTDALVIAALLAWRTPWSRRLRANPVAVSAVLAITGTILFAGWHNNPQPRYYVVLAFFSFLLLAEMVGSLAEEDLALAALPVLPLLLALATDLARDLSYIRRPSYSLVAAADGLRRYIDQHPNGRPLLLSVSGSQFEFINHLPAICDDFGTDDLDARIARYRPGWYAAWNDLDPGTLEDIHRYYTLEQVASFPALDDPERNRIFLFKLHPLAPGSGVTEAKDLRQPLPGDRFSVPIE